VAAPATTTTEAAPSTAPPPEVTAPPELPPLTLVPIAELEWPTALTSRPGEDDTLYVAEQAGRIRRVDVSGTEAVLDEDPVLDLSDEVRVNNLGGEPGLLGLAFSADGATLYASYSAFLGEDDGWDRKVVSFEIDEDGDVDPDSAVELVSFHKDNPNHQGGDIRLGPDGYLYLSFGDDRKKSIAQNPTDLLAGLLRIDPTTTSEDSPYAIPADNPFADGGGAAEVWLYGARNPWRFDIDPETGDLWVGDVGFETMEEIDRLPGNGPDAVGGAGANLGWPIFEGTERLDDVREPGNYVPPVFTYPREPPTTCAVIGGRVYLGTELAALEGAFVFSDFCGKQLRALRPTGSEPDAVEVVDLDLAPDRAVTAIGTDATGELYVLTSEAVWRIEAA